jgi:hypothetical protein
MRLSPDPSAGLGLTKQVSEMKHGICHVHVVLGGEEMKKTVLVGSPSLSASAHPKLHISRKGVGKMGTGEHQT